MLKIPGLSRRSAALIAVGVAVHVVVQVSSYLSEVAVTVDVVIRQISDRYICQNGLLSTRIFEDCMCVHQQCSSCSGSDEPLPNQNVTPGIGMLELECPDRLVSSWSTC